MLNDCVGEEFKGTVQTPTNFTIHIYLPGVVFFLGIRPELGI